MGELIRPNFGNKNRDSGPNSEKGEENKTRAQLAAEKGNEALLVVVGEVVADLQARLENNPEVADIKDDLVILENLEELLALMDQFGMYDKPSDTEAREDAAEIWFHSSDQELAEAVKESNQFEWNKFPEKYQALYLEYRRRAWKILNRETK